MSDRERWIVYPLLLLALGASLKNKLTKTVDTEHVVCRRLTLINDEGKPLMAFGANRDGTFGVIESKQGALSINGPVRAKQMRCEELAIIDRDGQRCMTLDVAYMKKDDGSAETHSGRLTLFDAKNKPQVALAKSPVGGTVTAFDDTGKGVIIGHVQPQPGERWAGLFTIGSDGKIKPLGTKFDPGVEPKKPTEPKPQPKLPEIEDKKEDAKEPEPTDLSER